MDAEKGLSRLLDAIREKDELEAEEACFALAEYFASGGKFPRLRDAVADRVLAQWLVSEAAQSQIKTGA